VREYFILRFCTLVVYIIDFEGFFTEFLKLWSRLFENKGQPGAQPTFGVSVIFMPTKYDALHQIYYNQMKSAKLLQHEIE
jgi:hypothetical protein